MIGALAAAPDNPHLLARPNRRRWWTIVDLASPACSPATSRRFEPLCRLGSRIPLLLRLHDHPALYPHGRFASIGLSRDLFRLSAAWLGRARRRRPRPTIGTCAGFGAICNSSVATTATMVNMALPELLKTPLQRRPPPASSSAAQQLGSIIPPSMIMVIYRHQAEQSVRGLASPPSCRDSSPYCSASSRRAPASA